MGALMPCPSALLEYCMTGLARIVLCLFWAEAVHDGGDLRERERASARARSCLMMMGFRARQREAHPLSSISWGVL